MIVLSLQGGMAVGKTTAARYLARHAPDLHVCLEDNRAVIGQVQRLGLDKTRCDDYIRIQRLWLQHEMDRWQQARSWPCTVMDFGAEEIEFYTLHYPRTIGQDWDVEGPLARELLDAPDPVLRRRKEGDAARDRGFFEHYLQELLPLKRAWFAQKDNVDVLQTAGMTPEQVGAAALEWAVRWSR